MMNKPEKNCCIPALKKKNGEWVLTPGEKTEVFSTTFEEKVRLPVAIANDFTMLHQTRVVNEFMLSPAYSERKASFVEIIGA